MSSTYVRTQIKSFLTANAPTETQVDLTALYQELKELIGDIPLGPEDPWLGLQFVGDGEIPVSTPAGNTTGRYRETGVFFLHFVSAAKLGVGTALLARGETLRNLFRGRRIGEIIIDSVSPMNFDSGATLQFEGGYMSGSFICGYRRDFSL